MDHKDGLSKLSPGIRDSIFQNFKSIIWSSSETRWSRIPGLSFDWPFWSVDQSLSNLDCPSLDFNFDEGHVMVTFGQTINHERGHTGRWSQSALWGQTIDANWNKARKQEIIRLGSIILDSEDPVIPDETVEGEPFTKCEDPNDTLLNFFAIYERKNCLNGKS